MSEPSKDLVASDVLEWLQPYNHSAGTELTPVARKFLSRSIPANTKRTYKRILQDFLDWSAVDQPLPTTPGVVVNYLTDRAHHAGLAPSTLSTYRSALRFAHRALGLPDPTKEEVVTQALRGIKRVAQDDHGWIADRAPALRLGDLEAMVCPGLDPNALRDIRDRAFLLAGFFGAFRQSELSAIRVERLRESDQGLLVRMGASKTDQLDMREHHKALPFGPQGLCPVEAMREWLAVSEINAEWVFRGVTKSGKLATPSKNVRVRDRLSHSAANRILTHRARLAGLPNPGYSVHSLRAGFITDARAMGAPDHHIQRQSGHQDVRTLNRYDRPESAFNDNAVNLLMAALRAPRQPK